MNRFFLFALLTFALAACQTPDTAEPDAETPVQPVSDTESDRAAIEALTADYTAAVQAGDAAAVSALYADDALIHPPGEPSAKGRVALDAYFARIHAEPVDLTFSTEEVGVAESGDLAYEVGTWDGGRYLTIYRRTAEGWEIVADSWSNDAPATGTN